MMVYLLVALMTTNSVIGNKTFTAEVLVFETADRCIKNVDNIKHQLEKQYS